MKRRDFLKNTVFASGATLIPSFLKGMEFLTPEQLTGYRNVIIIQLSGGNDGLNTIVPVQNDQYQKMRPEISKKSANTIKITDELSFNSSFQKIATLYHNGDISIINNVGYPNPNRSHFRSSDIWYTASGSDQYLNTGWIGRYLDAHCQFPYEAIEIDKGLSLALKGEQLKGISITNPNLLYQNTREPFIQEIADHTDSPLVSNNHQQYLYKTLLETYSSASYIKEHSKIHSSKVSYPNTAFAKNLKQIAAFIQSGLKTRVYYSSLSGFDTHANQVNNQDRLLKIYAEAIDALIKDLKTTKRFKDTLILTFSEFGRSLKQNASRGTDHGTANTIFIMSGSLKKPGFYNEAPDLLSLDESQDIRYSIDFRSVYATILSKWLKVDDRVILNEKFKKLDFI